MIGTALTVPSNMRIVMIPAKAPEEIKKVAKCLKVAAYCRVSTDDKEQKTSYEAQIQYYTNKINKNPDWQMAGIFADEGITGTQAKKRPQFLKMIRLCRQGKIDVILTKSLSRFARNTVDSLNYIRELKMLGIAVISEKENINTLTAESEMLITSPNPSAKTYHGEFGRASKAAMCQYNTKSCSDIKRARMISPKSYPRKRRS